MARSEDDGSAPEFEEDKFAILVTELERIVGAEEFAAGDFHVEWLLPIGSTQDFLALIRAAPAGIGVVGLEEYLKRALGTLSGLKAVEGNGPDSDV
jgi:hypothetical protein